MTIREVRGRMSTIVHKTIDPVGERRPRTMCGTYIGADPWLDARVWQWQGDSRSPVITECPRCNPPHQHEEWMLAEKGNGSRYCRACGADVEPSRTRDSDDLSPSVSVQHRCPRMREHIIDLDYPEPGQAPGSLPVPCGDCYSIVVTTIRVPWQPSREFTITTEEK